MFIYFSLQTHFQAKNLILAVHHSGLYFSALVQSRQSVCGQMVWEQTVRVLSVCSVNSNYSQKLLWFGKNSFKSLNTEILHYLEKINKSVHDFWD